VLGIFILRRKRPQAEPTYRALGYPFLPALYILAAAAIAFDLLLFKPTYTWPGLIIVLPGVVVYFLWKRNAAKLQEAKER
jgi:APA family basic amino acid/polyamine antiporter